MYISRNFWIGVSASWCVSKLGVSKTSVVKSSVIIHQSSAIGPPCDQHSIVFIIMAEKSAKPEKKRKRIAIRNGKIGEYSEPSPLRKILVSCPNI